MSSSPRSLATKIQRAIQESIPIIESLARPEHRFAALLAIINRVIEEEGKGKLIVVGGFALELLLGGIIRTLDVDFIVVGYDAYKAVKEALKRLEEIHEKSARGPIMSLAGAEKALDLLGPTYRSDFAPIRVEVPGFGWFYIEAPEQLLIRYLREWVYWNTEEARRRALLILGVLSNSLDLGKVNEVLQDEDQRLVEKLKELIKLLREKNIIEH